MLITKGDDKIMTPEFLLTLINVGLGLLLILMGFLIKVKQWSWLIAGYNTSSADEKAKYDTSALCNGVGNFMYFLGVCLFVVSIGYLLELSWVTSMGWGLFVVGIIVFLIYANTGGRYKNEGVE